MIASSGIDWTQVLISLIFGLPAILAAVFAYLIRREVKTPSGDKLGEVVERTHDNVAANLALSLTQAKKDASGTE